MGFWAFKATVYFIMPAFMYCFKKCHKEEIQEEPNTLEESKEGGSADQLVLVTQAEEPKEQFSVTAYNFCAKNRKALGKKIFFTEIIWLLLEPYLDLVIILFMQIRSKQKEFIY